VNRSEPIFNVPTTVVILIGIFVAVHAVRLLLPAAEDDWLVVALAFVPARYIGQAALLPGGDVASITSFITHMLVHGDLMHLLFNTAWFLAFGGAVALRVGGTRFMLFVVVTGVAGALAFLAFNFGELIPMVGASGAVSGLMGGVLRFMFSAIDRGNLAALRDAPRGVALMPLSVALRDRRVLAIIAVLVLINLLSVAGLFGPSGGGGIAWEAHLGGFAAGFLLFGFFDIPERPKPRLVH